MPAIETLVRELPQTLELKPKAVFAALRLGMSGQSVTPGLFESLWVLGRDQAVAPARAGCRAPGVTLASCSAPDDPHPTTCSSSDRPHRSGTPRFASPRMGTTVYRKQFP